MGVLQYIGHHYNSGFRLLIILADMHSYVTQGHLMIYKTRTYNYGAFYRILSFRQTQLYYNYYVRVGRRQTRVFPHTAG